MKALYQKHTRSHLKKTEVKLSSIQVAAYPGNYRHDIRTERQAA